MPLRPTLRNRFTASVDAAMVWGWVFLYAVGFCVLVVKAETDMSAGKQAEEARQQKQDAAIQLLKQRYPGSPRLQAIIEGQKTISGEHLMKFLATNDIELELSADGLPDGAAIRLFKNCWQINPFLPVAAQMVIVNLAADYAYWQARDGLPYGVGESFAAEGGRWPYISSVGSVKTTKPNTLPTGLCAPQP